MTELGILKKLATNQTVLILTPNINYNDVIIHTTQEISRDNRRICYISLNKTYGALKEHLSAHNINLANTIFIDGITKNVKDDVENTDDCIYIDSPIVPAELLQTISALLTKHYDFLVFDSLTNLITYQKEPSVEYLS
jgi:hypothetical protein